MDELNQDVPSQPMGDQPMTDDQGTTPVSTPEPTEGGEGEATA